MPLYNLGVGVDVGVVGVGVGAYCLEPRTSIAHIALPHHSSTLTGLSLRALDSSKPVQQSRPLGPGPLVGYGC